MKQLFVSLLLAVSLGSFAQTGQKLTTHKDSIDALVQVIRDGKMISSQHVGFTGAPSPQWYSSAFLANLATIDDLLEMIKDSSPAVRYSGYIGLLYNKYPDINLVTKKFLADSTEVSTIAGCIANATTIRSLVQQKGNWYPAELLTNFWQQSDAHKSSIFDAVISRKPIKGYPSK